jgi:hypothetical protein
MTGRVTRQSASFSKKRLCCHHAGKLDSCFVVRDANRQALAYMYFEKGPRRPLRRELLTRDEAERAHAVMTA